VIQFIAPSMQFACGLLVFGEPFESARATGFVLIWIGLAIYAGSGLMKLHEARARASASYPTDR